MKLDFATQEFLRRAFKRKGSEFITAATGVPFDTITSAMRGHEINDDVASSLTRWCKERVEIGVSDLDVKAHFSDPKTWNPQRVAT